MLFSVPGRTEVSGNHTDHNHGRVIAAAVDPDVIAVVRRREDGVIRIKSEGFDEDEVAILPTPAPNPSEYFTSRALIAGVAAGMSRRGYAVCGFDAYTTSNVRKGSGISSSAAFEVLVGKILSVLACKDSVSHPELARIAKEAENLYFGKPSGLMHALKILKDIEQIGIHRFEKKDIVRHALVQQIVDAYEKKSNEGKRK